jgi:hypothetical protein
MSVSFLVLVGDADAGFIPTVGFGRTVGGRRRNQKKVALPASASG